MENTKWTEFLNKNYCEENPLTGNRPCDNGKDCSACHTEKAKKEFELFKIDTTNMPKEEVKETMDKLVDDLMPKVTHVNLTGEKLPWE